MKLLTNLKYWYNSRANAPIRRPRRPILSVKGLEDRQVPTTLLLLDFDGMTRAEHSAALGLHRPGPWTPVAVTSFVGEFATLNTEHTWSDGTRRGGYAEFSFLDFNRDGRLDAVDGDIAAGRILAQVRADYSPYDVQVVREDVTDSALTRMRSSPAHDTLVAISGHPVNVGGQAALDPDNHFDSFAGAFGSVSIAHWIYDIGGRGTTGADAFVNATANFIAHEAGHTFGLDHIDVAVNPESQNRSLMTPLLGWTNCGFADKTYWATGPTDRLEDDVMQNEHQYLTETMGASPLPWAAVLQPGVLTIQGSGAADVAWVTAAGADPASDMSVTVGAGSFFISYHVDPAAAPDINSINQYGTLTTIRFFGGDKNDALRVSETVGARVWAYGGAGDDILEGGAGADVFYGQDGADQIFGRGGADVLWGGNGNDVLDGGSMADGLYGEAGDDILRGGDGNDLLDGGANNDRLEGGAGADQLFGGFGDDFLDGGHDFVRDNLTGGAGVNIFVDHRVPSVGGPFDPTTTWRSEDLLVDFTAGIDRIERHDWWF